MRAKRTILLGVSIVVLSQVFALSVEAKEKELRAISDMVDEGIAILSKGQDVGYFGRLLHEAWQVKRSLSSKVSNSNIEEIYNQAMAAGALGGKLIGAGGGGFMLLFARPQDQSKVREKLSKLVCVPFQFEFAGSQVIFFDPEEDYSMQEMERANRSILGFKEHPDI